MTIFKKKKKNFNIGYVNKNILKFTLQITFLPITFKKFQNLPQFELWQAPDSVSNIFFKL